MRRSLLAPALGFIAAGLTARGAEPASAGESAAVPPVLVAPAPKPSAPARALTISTETAAKLAAVGPKFAPAISPAAKAAATSMMPEPSADRPRNGIVRLPRYIVREEKPPAFKEYEILTPKGRLDLARKRFPGIRLGSLPFMSNDGIALALLQQEIDLERKREAYDMLYVIPAAEQGRYKDLLDDTFMKRETFGGGH